MVWTGDEREVNHGKHYIVGKSQGGITWKASKTAIWRSKGIDRLRLCDIWKEAEDRVLCIYGVSREAPKDCLVFTIQDNQRAVEDTH